MAKQLNVKLDFEADTKKAKSQIEDLVNSLNKISQAGFSKNSSRLSTEINQAAEAASKLMINLRDATNVNTGKLDLTKFASSMRSSGMDLQKYRQQLTSLGPEGQQAFVQLAQSITTAEIPLKRSGKLLTEFKNTLMNTARWQLSSSMLHGFMGAISTAYGYAQDLNKSLNNIRIVTGYSADKMADFAIEANKAAKALSTTTTEYTDAALIYYQQGIRNQTEIAERTATTIKLANVSRQSAEDVSQQMTAIWNNFYNGSQSLEYYADAITALGATTASSSEEIATGLEKFAAVSKTVGLSYEYATAALATITAQTRQSADTVGTGLRTLFARLESVKLGETLDDGVELTKYTKALADIGVQVIDTSGEMRSMDNILEDMAARWQNLDQAQKAAVANTVGGVRQYANLIALMDNWDKMQENILTAKGSEGTLQQQAEIYAESWEAAQKRVKAAAQSIYGALLDDEFFIALSNGFAEALNGIDNFIDKIGGLKGVLLTIGAIVTTVFQKEIAQGLSNLAYQVSMKTGLGRKKMTDLQTEANQEMVKSFVDQDTKGGDSKVKAYTALKNEQDAYIKNQDRMSASEREINKLIMQRHQSLAKDAAAAADEADQAERNLKTQERILKSKLNQGNNKNNKDVDDLSRKLKNLEIGHTAATQLAADFESLDAKFGEILHKGDLEGFNKVAKDIELSSSETQRLRNELIKIGGNTDEAKTKAEELMNKFTTGTVDSQDDLKTLELALNNIGDKALDADAKVSNYKIKLLEAARAAEEEGRVEKGTAAAIERVVEASEKNAAAQADMKAKTDDATQAAERHGKKMNENSGKTIELSQGITQMAGAFMSAAMAVTQITGLIKTLNDENATTGEKITAVITTLGMVVPMVIGSIIPAVKSLSATVQIEGAKMQAMMWQVTLIMVAVGALVAGIIAAFKAAEAASPEGVYKAAKKATEDATKAADKCKEAYDNLNNSLKSLDDGIESIKNMERGTLEWRNAINESNAALIDLLQSYGMLQSQYFETDADGLMTLTQKARDLMLQLQSTALNKSREAQYSQQIAENTAKNKLDISNTIGKNISVQRTQTVSDGNGGSYTTTYDAASTNSQLTQDIGQALTKAFSAGVIDLNNVDTLQEALSGVSNLTEQEVQSIADQIVSNGDLQSQIIELASAVQANTEANRILAGQMIDSKYGNEIAKSGVGKAGQDAIEAMLGDKLNELADALYESTYKDNGWLAADTYTDAEIQKKYAEAMGYATDTIENMSGNKAKYYGKDGKEIGVISDEVARRYMARQEALEQLAKTDQEGSQSILQTYTETVQNLIAEGDKIADGVGEALLSSVGGFGAKLNTLTGQQLEDLAKQISKNEDGSFNIGGTKVTEEMAKSLGYESVEAYYKSIDAALKNAAFDTDSIIENSKLTETPSKAIRKLFEEIDINSLTKDQAEKIANAYQTIYDQGDKAALDAMDEFLEQFDKEQKLKVAEMIANQNWDDWDAGDTLQQALEAAGLTNVEYLDEFVDKMRTATGAIKHIDIEPFRKNFAEITKILNSLSEWGASISAEEYEKLGEDYENYFTLMADGTYKLTGDAEAFHKAVMQDNRQKLANNINDAKGIRENSSNTLNTANSAMHGYSLTKLSESAEWHEGENWYYSSGQVKAQIDFMQSVNAISSDQAKIWLEAEKNGQLYQSVWNEINTAMADAVNKYNDLNGSIEENEKIERESTQALLSTATGLDDLNEIIETYSVDVEKYGDLIATEKEILWKSELQQADTLEKILDIQERYKLSDEEVAKAKRELALEQANEAETLDEVLALTEEYGFTVEEVGEKIAGFADNLLVLNRLREQELINEEQYNARAKELIQTRFEEADSIQALDNILSELHQTAVDIKDEDILTFNAYSEALIRLGEACDNASAETYQYREALEDVMRAQEKASELSQRLQEYYEDEYSSEGEALEVARQLAEAEKDLAKSKEKLAEAEDYLRAAVKASEGASKYGFDAKVIENQAKEIRQLNRDIELSAEEAVELAIANQRLNRGIKTLNENFEDWRKTLEESNPESIDYAEALTNVESAIADLIGAADDFDLPPDFLEMPEVLDLIDQAAEGDAQAINELGIACAQAQINVLELDESFAHFFEIGQDEFDTYKQAVLQGIQDITDNLPSLIDGTMSIQDAISQGAGSWIESLNQMALATGMSVDQMNGLLNELGVQAKVDVKSVPQSMEVPTYDEYSMLMESGNTTASFTGPDGEVHEYQIPKYHRKTWTVPGEPIKVDGYTQVAQISTVEGKTPEMSINYTGVGGTASKSGTSTPRGGGVSKSSTAPRAEKKKSGGSKGSTSKKETKEHKNLVDEKERYHVINQQIERQNNLLERLSKNKDRAFGPNKQKYYAQELKSLKDMGKMYEEHLRQSSQYLAQDKAVMQAWGAKISAKDGTILNYDALLKAQVDAYNRAVDRYNASGQTDADKDALKAAEDRFKKFQDDLKQYEDTVKTHEEDINKYIDNMIEQYDTMQAKTADAIEFRIEYDDSVLDFLDKLIDRLDSWNGSMFAAVDIMGKLNDKTGALIEKNKDLETATAETLEHFLMDYKEFDKNGNITFQTGLSKQASQEFISRFNANELTTEDIQMLAHMPEEERQLLMDYAQQRQDNTDALIETAQAVVDNVERQFNDAKDELAEAARPIREATAALDNYAAIIDIVGADYLGVTDDIMLRFRDQQWNVLHDTTMANKATMEALGEQRDMIEDLMNKALAAGDDELAEMYREKLKGINDEVQSATEAWYSSWQAELSKLEEDFEKHIDEIKNKALDLAAGPNNTWQSLKDTMDYAQKAAERFLPEYKEIYEFSKLNRDINKSIDDTDNVKNKQALKKLQEEINKLQERSGEISQYDLDNARRKYELELARLALEESRNAKDTVRLSKDSEGNWSYIYTANEEDVANAEQNYEDKLYAMQSANADYINNLQGQLTQATEDYYNKVAEINLVYKDDDDRRREELAKAKAQYEETMGYYSNELQKAMDNNKQLYEEDWAWYSDYTKKINDDQGYRLGELDNYITDFNDTMLGMATGYDNLAAMEDAMLDHAADAERQMNEAYEHLAAQIELSMADAGTSVDEFAQEMMEQVDGTIVPKADEGRDAVETLADETTDAMQALVDQADAWRRKYEQDMQAIIDKNNLVVQSIQAVTGALSTLHKQEIGHDESTGGTGSKPEGAGSGSTGVGKDATGSGSKYSRSDFMNYTYSGNGTDRKYYINGQYVGRIVGFENGVSVQDTTEAKVIQALINAGIWGNNYTSGSWNPVNHRSKEEIFKQFGFRSGGYTGDWAGTEGRLALLHQKELVLDEADTQNMLKSIEIVRSLASMIDLNAKASELAIGNLSATSAHTTRSQMEQTVTITAEFPNATDRNEIAEAFDILINQASQYANRKY